MTVERILEIIEDSNLSRSNQLVIDAKDAVRDAFEKARTVKSWSTASQEPKETMLVWITVTSYRRVRMGLWDAHKRRFTDLFGYPLYEVHDWMPITEPTVEPFERE